MSTEVVEIDRPVNSLTIIERLIDSHADSEQVAKLVDLYERMQRTESERAYNSAMRACQQEMPRVIRDTQGANAKFAKLEDIHDICKPIWLKHGFSLSFSEDPDHAKDGMKRFVCRCMHEAGHTKVHDIQMSLDATTPKGSPNAMTPPQRDGSTMSYGKRYLECGIFDITIAGQDNDGGRNSELASMEQRSEVNMMLDELKTTDKAVEPGKFLKWLGIERMEQLTVKGFDSAVRELNSRRRQAKPLKSTKEAK